MRQRLINLYARYERHVSSAGLFSGFVFDFLALKRIDLFWENVWVGVHLIVASLGILAINYYFYRTKNPEKEYRVYGPQFWLILVIQFAFGGLLSTFLVFYFRGSTFSAAWPFLFLLAIAFVGNEAFKKHYAQITYQVSVLFISIFSFAIYIVPVIIHNFGDAVFVYSGFISLGLISVFVSLMRLVSSEHVLKNRKTLRLSIFALYFLINGLYFSNFIPPIPLSLKEAGVYHSILRNQSGNYDVTEELFPWYNFFDFYPPIDIVAGDPVYVYSAVFSPSNLDLTLSHEWQWYDESSKTWLTHVKVDLPIIGGRDGGYRTYSFSSSVFPGLWRVNVLTPNGKLVGQINFEIKNVSATPVLIQAEI